MSQDIGRNQPCPCGSGKKYKRCCLELKERERSLTTVDSAVMDYEWQKIRSIEGELVNELLAFGKARRGPDFLIQAWHHYIGSKDIAMDELPEFETSFMPWVFFNHIPAQKGQGKTSESFPLAIEYLIKKGMELDEYCREYIFAICNSPYSFFAVTAVESGRSISLRDLFTGNEVTVKERQGSQSVSIGDILYTRVLSLDETSVMVGMAPIAFPPAYHLSVLDFREAIFGRRRKISADDLLMVDDVMRDFYFDLKENYINPPPPVLTNTDGELYAHIKITYDLKCAPQDAFEALRSLSVHNDDEVLLSGAQYDAKSALHAVTFDWLRKRSKKHPSWENTVLGKISLEGAGMTVEVNSENRSRTIQSEISKRLKGRAVFKHALQESVEKMLEDFRKRKPSEKELRGRNEQEKFQKLPEMQEHLRKMMEAHWNGWVDHPLPALDGKTPRQASKTARGKERLEALLMHFERKSTERENPLLRPNVADLRQRLGLGGNSRTPAGE